MVLLKDIIVILFLAVIIIVIAAKFRIPPIIGFLITGMIIGPSAFQLVETTSEIQFLAEIGIILLMFSIGLEFSISKVKEIKRSFFFFGGLQVLLCWIIFSILLLYYGLQFQQAFFAGFILSLSSTAIILKLLQDQDELSSPAGLKMTGILLFQDAAIIPVLILLPFVYQLSGALSAELVFKIAIPLIGITLVFFLSRLLIPKIFSIILILRIPELLMVTVFVLLFGIAFVTHQLGASLAIGAFIAGSAISESDYASQINTEIIPSRHIFNSIFFISIGMFVNISFFFKHLDEVLLITILIVVFKSIIILSIFLLSRHPLNEGFIVAFGLAHIGEFSFILLNLSQDYNLFTQDIYQLLLSATVLSMFTIPFALIIGKKVSGFEIFKKKVPPHTQITSLMKHTIIAGFGLNGQNIARILKLLNIPYLIIDINPVTVKKYKSRGEPIYYGDIDREENLKNAALSKASLLIIAISNMDACMRAIKIAKELNPALKVIARSNFLSQVEEMYKQGADLVLSQDMETSLIFIHHILKFYQMPDHVARIQTNLLRKEHYKFFSKEVTKEAWKIALFDYIEQDNELFFVGPFSKHVSKKIGEIEPFSYKDMQIIGIIRNNNVLTQSIQDIVIEKYDTIIFSGNHKKVFEATSWMEENN